MCSINDSPLIILLSHVRVARIDTSFLTFWAFTSLLSKLPAVMSIAICAVYPTCVPCVCVCRALTGKKGKWDIHSAHQYNTPRRQHDTTKWWALVSGWKINNHFTSKLLRCCLCWPNGSSWQRRDICQRASDCKARTSTGPSHESTMDMVTETAPQNHSQRRNARFTKTKIAGVLTTTNEARDWQKEQHGGQASDRQREACI